MYGWCKIWRKLNWTVAARNFRAQHFKTKLLMIILVKLIRLYDRQNFFLECIPIYQEFFYTMSTHWPIPVYKLCMHACLKILHIINMIIIVLLKTHSTPSRGGMAMTRHFLFTLSQQLSTIIIYEWLFSLNLPAAAVCYQLK